MKSSSVKALVVTAAIALLLSAPSWAQLILNPEPGIYWQEDFNELKLDPKQANFSGT